jgi:thiamine monophosphate synthase
MMHVTYDGSRTLARRADAVCGPRGAWPVLFAFTDPQRTPDPAGLARSLPAGCGLVLRTFGREELERAAFDIAEIARANALTLLISADPELARRCGAHGVHWPQARLADAARHRTAFRLMSASAHSPAAARRAAALVDLVFVSPAFASQSPSAGRALGGFRMAAYARRTPAPIYALGGISARSVKRLKGLGLSGVAAIDGVKGDRP